MKTQDLIQAFSAVDPHFRSEAQQIAARTNRRRRIRRTVTRIAAGLTAACGGLLALGVYLQANDGINVQTTGYPIEEVHETTADAQLTTTVTADSTERETTADSTAATDDAALFEEIMHGTTPYILPFCEDGTLIGGADSGSLIYVLNSSTDQQYEVRFGAPADRALTYTFRTVPSQGSVTIYIKADTPDPTDDLESGGLAQQTFDADGTAAPLTVTVPEGTSYCLYLKADKADTAQDTHGVIRFTIEDNTPTSEVTGTEAAAVQTVRAAETTAMPAVTAAQTTAETAAAVQTTVQTEQQTAAETEPQTYQPGDIDMDGHLTYADYMLAWMYQYYLTLPETTGSYPQMLNAAQIAIYNDIDTIEIDMSQYFDKTLNPSEARAAATPSLKLDAAVTSLMQPTDMSAKASLFAASPEQIGSITDTDFACIQSGCLHGLADHAYLLGQYYLCQLLPEKYGQRSTSITAEQVDAYLDFLREACIAREKQLST